MASTTTQTIELEHFDLRQPSSHDERSAIPVMTGVPIPGDTVAPAPTSEQRVFQQESFSAMGSSRKITILVLIVTCNLIQMISNIIGISAGFDISKELGVMPGPGKANWVAASYPLTQGTFVLISGRLGAVYGHKNVLLAGGAWFVLWSVINGFMEHFAGFVIARALSGVGGALIMPNVVALIAITCPPGKVRNISLGIFGASAPMGGYLGGIIAGAFIEIHQWRWTLFTLAISGAVVFASLAFLLPGECPQDRYGKIDWIGAALGTSGLIVFNVAWNQAPAVGWSTAYEIALVIASVVLMGIFTIWEKYYAKTPILPLDIWKAPSFVPLIGAALLCFMSFGTLLWYMTAWQQLVRHWSVIKFSVGWTPFGLFAIIGAFLAAWLVPRLAAQWILAIGAASVLVSNLLLATMPEQQIYWAQVFPTTILMAFCPDFVYVAAQIIASNSVKRSQQGVAASLIGTLNLYGNSLGLGFAGTVETEVNKGSSDPVRGYRAALFFGAALAAAALVLDVMFVRVKKDDREGWEDEEDRLDAVGQEPEGASTGISHL